MLANVNMHPEPPVADITVPFLAVVGLLVILFVVDWMRQRGMGQFGATASLDEAV
jgi:hypothetical protein